MFFFFKKVNRSIVARSPKIDFVVNEGIKNEILSVASSDQAAVQRRAT
jgi:hypothetical protein